MIGYSAGGETALILSRAQPDLDPLRRYCLERPHDADAYKTKDGLIADRAALCDEPEGVDRETIHLLLQEEAAHFFTRRLSRSGRSGLDAVINDGGCGATTAGSGQRLPATTGRQCRRSRHSPSAAPLRPSMAPR